MLLFIRVGTITDVIWLPGKFASFQQVTPHTGKRGANTTIQDVILQF